jgi:hypothetical protein
MASSDDYQNGDRIDAAGQSILRLLEKAGETTDQYKRQALEMAQKVSHELRAAQDRIGQLEDEVVAYRDRAERAELWLDKIRAEIEQQFSRGRRNAPR